MNAKDITAMIVGVTIALLVTVTVAVPIVSVGVANSGNPVEFTNVTDAVVDYNYDYLRNAEYTITVESDGNYTIDFNGTIIERKTDNFPIFFSDIGFSEGYSTVVNDLVNVDLWDNEEDTQVSFTVLPSNVGETSVVFSNGVCTLTKVDGTTYSLPYKWLMGITPDGDYITYTGSISPLYVVDVDNIVTYSGNYTTGENDTYYAYAKGVGYAQGEFSDKVSFDYVGGSLVEGTTDVYTGGNGRITIDGESFTPYRCLIKENVIGHESGSVVQTLLEVLPIFVVIGLVVGIALSMRGRRI